GAPLWDGLLRTLAGEGRLEWVRRYWATAFVGEAARARMQSERVWVPLILAERTLVGAAARRALQEGAGPDVGAAIAWVEGPLLREAMAGVRGTAPGVAREMGSEAARAAAIRLLGEAVLRGVSSEADLADLAGVELRGEEVGALRAAWSAQESAEFAEILLSRWGTWPPRARSLALSVLLERESSAARLVSALERGLVRPVELDAAQRQRLASHAQEGVRRRAQALFQGEASRAEVVARYAGVVDLDGDSAAGRTHFEKLCATCHQLHGVGHAVGPDLVPFIPKRIPDFLVAILDPSAAIDPRYLAYDLVLKDGREVTGVVRSESAQSIELLQANGVREVVLRADVARLNPQQRSLMPEGLETGLGPQDLADLVAWIRRPNPVGAGPR
ncbi:MAG: c-type cytochrome, partial [Verrucomicrobiales bacterium]|nr:c-type cytochrome [Verrucomicrobiales bacterium]